MDPLTVRELQGLSRRGLTYLTRGLYVALVGAVVYVWGISELGSVRSLSPSHLANLGRQLFNALVLLQMFLVGVGAILGSADMIHKEIRSRTLATVISTPMSGIAIVWAKWKASMIQSIALMLCSLPGFAICSYLGAIGPWQMAWSASLTLGLAAIGAALGLRHAVNCRTTAGATMLSICEFAAVGFVLVLLTSVFDVFGVLLVYFYPFGALYAVTNTAKMGSFGEYGWVTSTALEFVVSLWLIRRTGRTLLLLSNRIEEPDPDLTEDRGLLVAGAAVRSWITETRVWDDEPLLWKELATRPGVRLETYLGKPLIWGTLALIAPMWLGTGGINTTFLLLMEALTLVSVLLMGSGLFIRDRETRWNEIILCTPLSSYALLRAKLLSGVLAPESVYALGVGAVVLVGWTLPLGVLPCLFAVLAVAVFFLFAYLLAGYCSLLARSNRGAFLWAAGLLSIVFVAFPSHSIWKDQYYLFASEMKWTIWKSLSSLNPVIFLQSDRNWGQPDPERPTFALASFLIAYGAASLVLMGIIGATFNRMRGRR